MFPEERIRQIKEIVKEKGKVNVSFLADKFQVSLPTIRGDLDKIIEEDASFQRTHGGILFIDENIIEKKNSNITLYSKRLNVNNNKKKEIATKALDYIIEKETLLLDSSTTCFELSKLLVGTKSSHTIITTGLSSAMILKENPNLTVIIPGGILKPDSNTILDAFQENDYMNLNIDKFFFSASGLSLQSGFSEKHIPESLQKKDYIKKSKINIALIDSSKFEQDTSSSFCKLNDIDLLITDSGLPAHQFEKYNKHVKIVT